MKKIKEFSIKKKSDSDSTLFFRGESCQIDVSGLSLEEQFKIDSFYLIFITDNCPYEEYLYIYLLNQKISIIDSLNVGLPYTPGLLKNIKLISNNTIDFDFHDNIKYQLLINFKKYFLNNFFCKKYLTIKKV